MEQRRLKSAIRCAVPIIVRSDVSNIRRVVNETHTKLSKVRRKNVFATAWAIHPLIHSPGYRRRTRRDIFTCSTVKIARNDHPIPRIFVGIGIAVSEEIAIGHIRAVSL